MSTSDQILNLLAEIAGEDEVKHDPDLRLYDLEILDSLKTVELIVAFGENFGVEISPAEFEREQWATPRAIVQFMESRLTH